MTFDASGLPNGLMIDPSNGVISGTPTQAGTFSVTVTATNAEGSDTTTFDLVIEPEPVVPEAPSILPVSAPAGRVGEAYDFTVPVSGDAPITFSATGLPSGLTIDPSTGVISGTPTQAGTFTVNVTASNPAGTGEAAFAIVIDAAPVGTTITSAGPPDGKVGEAYSFTVTAAGDAPVTFGATGLPNGLTINASTGVISGTPTRAGTFTPVVTATNAAGSDTKAYQVVIAPASTGPVVCTHTFIDLGIQNIFEDDICWLASERITRGCNPPTNSEFCPKEYVTRGQMAAFLVRALGLTEPGRAFDDAVGHVFAGDISRLAAVGITRGCNPPLNDRFCPDDVVTRGQMAAFLVRALELADVGEGFEDTQGHLFEGDIAKLAEADITRGCNPPANTQFCPDAPVTREQMAAFLRRALGS